MGNGSVDQVLFEIDAGRNALRVGDRVSVGQVIGEDAGTGQLVRAACEGQVEAISFSGADHTLLVLVKAEAHLVRSDSEGSSVCLKIDAGWCAVRVGDRVTPETITGKDAETSETVRARIHGRVQAIGFSPSDHSLILLIHPDSYPPTSWVNLEDGELPGPLLEELPFG